MNLIPVILSGGSGSRLWPLSTIEKPKPFLELFTETNLLEKTLQRLKNLQQPIVIVCNKKHLQIHEEVVTRNKIQANYILEEEGRNTAPAVLMAARVLEETGFLNSIMLVLPSDHYIEEITKFEKDIQLAAEQSQKGGLITFGIFPTSPETGFGYLHLKEKNKISPVLQFIEKPKLEKAKQFIKNKNYTWNSGIFCFSVKEILKNFSKFQVQFFRNSKICLQKSYFQKNKIFLHQETFQKFDSISLDYAIMEKSKEVFAIRASFFWNDVGNWSSVRDLLQKDNGGNILKGNVFSLDTKNSFLLAKNNFFGLLGLENITIIESEQGILVAHNSQMQEVKKIFEYRKNTKKPSVQILSKDPEILEITLYANQKYEFFVTQSCLIINKTNTAEIFIGKKKHILQKKEIIFCQQEKVFFKNNHDQPQRWIKIEFQNQKDLIE